MVQWLWRWLLPVFDTGSDGGAADAREYKNENKAAHGKGAISLLATKF